MQARDTGKHRCNDCPDLLKSVQDGSFFCGFYSAPNGTAWSLNSEYDPRIGWYDPQACQQCPRPGGGDPDD